MPLQWKFLFAMVAIYIIIGLVNVNYLKTISAGFLEDLVKILPVLLLAYIVVFIINMFVSPERISRHLGKNSGIKGWFYASLGSILISGPPYVILPVLGELKKHGMRNSFLAVFLNNRNVQPAFLPVMVYYFGLLFTVVISFYIMIFAIITGYIIGHLMRE